MNNFGGIYIHVPFCRKKCHYCHFFIHPYDSKYIENYLTSIEAEWHLRKHMLNPTIRTIYLGGGTPSLLTPSQAERILRLFPETAEEITIEANPEDVTKERIQGYKEIGINRISIGVQSLNDNELLTIGRNHGANKAIEAINIAYDAGIENISIDLMYDLPSQSFASWEKTVSQLVDLPIKHLSLYNMTFEVGSLYHKKQEEIAPQVPKDEESLKILEHGLLALDSIGLRRYEISAFAHPGFESKHNSSYWTAKPFIGLGPSAFSYIDGRRFQNICHLKKWATKVQSGLDPTNFSEKLPYPDNLHELLAVNLRLLSGINLQNFPTLPQTTLTTLDSLCLEGLLTRKNNTLSLTKKGTYFYDTIASQII